MVLEIEEDHLLGVGGLVEPGNDLGEGRTQLLLGSAPEVGLVCTPAVADAQRSARDVGGAVDVELQAAQTRLELLDIGDLLVGVH